MGFYKFSLTSNGSLFPSGKLKKIKMNKSTITFFSVIFFCFKLVSQNPFPANGELFRDDIVPRIDITIDPDSLKLIVDKTDIWSEHEYPADFVFDNGNIKDTIKNVGFRLRGNTSRFSQKKSFKVSFNTFEKGRKYYGVEKLNLNGEHNDPSIVRTKLCCDLAKEMGIIAPRANHVKLFINGNYFGLYINVEHIDEEFVKSRFGNNDGNLYKCTYPSDLNFKGTDPDVYKFDNDGVRVYELKTNEETDDYSDLADFIYKINFTIASKFSCELDKIFNVNDYIKIMVFDVLTGNWDNHAYNKNNFYLYHNTSTGKFEYILYDLDNTFGIDWFNIDWTARNIYSWSKSNEKRPLFTGVMNIPVYKSIFTAQMKKSLDSVFVPARLNDYLNQKRELIRIDAAADTYRIKDYGFTYSDFYNSYDKKIDYNHVTFGIKEYISRRYFYSFTQLNNGFLLPHMSDHIVRFTDQESLYFEAIVENPQLAVEIKAFYDPDQNGTFAFAKMADDGIYPDKKAGDKVYCSPVLQYDDSFNYYFSISDKDQETYLFPACNPAEYSVQSGLPEIAINEFMADNDNIIQDNNGDYDDWIELYNFGNEVINLGDLYITDNKSNPLKFQLPDISLKQNEFLLLWADDEEDEGNYHCNFKLSADGEYLGIFNSNAEMIDEHSFGPQETDRSEGRIPDGTGSFVEVNPTPGYANKTVAVDENYDQADFGIYPNPAFHEMTIDIRKLALKEKSKVMIFNNTGQLVFDDQIKVNDNYKVKTSDFNPGCYIISIINSKINIQKKFMILK